MCGADTPVREKRAASATLWQAIVVAKSKCKGSGQECPLHTDALAGFRRWPQFPQSVSRLDGFVGARIALDYVL